MSNGIATTLISATPRPCRRRMRCRFARRATNRRAWQLTREGVSARPDAGHPARLDLGQRSLTVARRASRGRPARRSNRQQQRHCRPSGASIRKPSPSPSIQARARRRYRGGRRLLGLTYSAEHGAYFAMSEPVRLTVGRSIHSCGMRRRSRFRNRSSARAGGSPCARTAGGEDPAHRAVCTASPEGRWSIDFAPRPAFGLRAGRERPGLSMAPASVALQGTAHGRFHLVRRAPSALNSPRPPLLIDVRRPPAFRSSIRHDRRRAAPATRRMQRSGPSLPGAAEAVVYCVHGHEVSQGAARALASGIPARATSRRHRGRLEGEERRARPQAARRSRA